MCVYVCVCWDGGMAGQKPAVFLHTIHLKIQCLIN